MRATGRAVGRSGAGRVRRVHDALGSDVPRDDRHVAPRVGGLRALPAVPSRGAQAGVHQFWGEVGDVRRQAIKGFVGGFVGGCLAALVTGPGCLGAGLVGGAVGFIGATAAEVYGLAQQ